jgi:hypothetical protein
VHSGSNKHDWFPLFIKLRTLLAFLLEFFGNSEKMYGSLLRGDGQNLILILDIRMNILFYSFQIPLIIGISEGNGEANVNVL